MLDDYEIYEHWYNCQILENLSRLLTLFKENNIYSGEFLDKNNKKTIDFKQKAKNVGYILSNNNIHRKEDKCYHI